MANLRAIACLHEIMSSLLLLLAKYSMVTLVYAKFSVQSQKLRLEFLIIVVSFSIINVFSVT